MGAVSWVNMRSEAEQFVKDMEFFLGGAFCRNCTPNPRKDFSTDNAASSVVILSLGNPSAAGTRRRQALQECPVMLA